jgi:hypothetical protein
MDTVNFILAAVIFIKETSCKINVKVTDKCFGLTEVFIKENGKMEFKMEKVKFI